MSVPDFIAHWKDLENASAGVYRGDTEPMGIDAPLSERLGITRIGIHHIRLLPGRRSSYPHAESTEEEFAYILEGEPDVWVDGVLHRLRPGDSVAFPAGTGICHTFINNTDYDVRMIVIGERTRGDNRRRYPLNNEFEKTRSNQWTDWPQRVLGPHNGLPEKYSLSRRADISCCETRSI